MRTLRLVCVIKPKPRTKPVQRKVIRLARFCAWHGAWMSAEDFVLHLLGMPTSHGLCDDCAKRELAKIDAMPTKPAA